MTRSALMIISDVHARYEVIDSQVRHAEASGETVVEQVVVLGDFGFFGDALHEHFRREGRRFLRPVAALDGNHEDHGALETLSVNYADVLTYLPRGSLHDFAPWRALCVGGAAYMDAAVTPRGSEITASDMETALAHGRDGVDLVLTHDCPSGIGVPNTPGMEHYGATGSPELSQLIERYAPRFWFFGHHHRWFDLERGGTRYVGLPQSWDGYILLLDDGALHCANHRVQVPGRPWWRRLLGMQ